MTIPSKTAWNIVPFHSFVSRNNIFERTGKQMSIVRQTRSKWRTIIKGEIRGIFSEVERLLKNFILFPKTKNSFLALTKSFVFNLFKHIAGRIENFCVKTQVSIRCASATAEAAEKKVEAFSSICDYRK